MWSKPFFTKRKTLSVTTVKFALIRGERARHALTVRKLFYFLKAEKSSWRLCWEGRALTALLLVLPCFLRHLNFFPTFMSLSPFVLDLKNKCPSSLPQWMCLCTGPCDDLHPPTHPLPRSPPELTAQHDRESGVRTQSHVDSQLSSAPFTCMIPHPLLNIPPPELLPVKMEL